MHIFTLSFDDGFKRSNLRIAEIFEKHNLSACLNVIATGHLKTCKSSDESQKGVPRGDFGLWNELKQRGHEIMPHGYRHVDKSKIPFVEARDLILRSLDIFSKKLEGFDLKNAIFNFPYNASTPELEAWLPTVVRAFRTGGQGVNPLPDKKMKKLTCTAFGPGNCEKHLDQQIDILLSQPGGWLIYCAHGLDREGWGPISTLYLERLLERLLSHKTVRIMPAGTALSQAPTDIHAGPTHLGL